MSNYVRCNKPIPNSGFTLIEVLVSITLMAMLATVVLSAMRSGLAIWDRGTNHLESLRRSRVVLDVLNDQIRGAMPLTHTVKVGERVLLPLAFEGSGFGLRFVSRASFKDGPDGIPRWVDIRWNSGELTVEERRILPPDNVPDSEVYWRGTVLQGESCTFDFRSDAQPGKPAAWLREWRYPVNSTLPRAIRLNCLLQAKNEVQLIIPLDYAESAAAGLTLR
jgi:prepilin-type N-terminal cleavage/methylation domain-containing protein